MDGRMSKNISGVYNTAAKCKKLIEFSNYACTFFKILLPTKQSANTALYVFYVYGFVCK